MNEVTRVSSGERIGHKLRIKQKGPKPFKISGKGSSKLRNKVSSKAR